MDSSKTHAPYLLARRAFGTWLLALAGGCGGGGAGSDAPAQSPGSAAGEAPQSAEEALPVFLLLGQSNMVGHGADPKELSAELVASVSALVFAGGAWETLRPSGAYQEPGSYKGMGFSPEIGLALALGRVGVVKSAANGSSLVNDWAHGGRERAKALALAKAALASRPSRLAGVLWMQGESDSFDEGPARAYRDNLRELVASLRAELGAPGVPFVAVRISPSVNFVQRDVVRGAQMDPGIARYAWIDTDDLDHGEDAVHFTGQAELELGRRFAKAFSGF